MEIPKMLTEAEAIEKDKMAAQFSIAATDLINSLISKHINTLTLKWDQTVSQDDYGNYLFDSWFKERDYFIDNVLRKEKIVSDWLGDSLADAYRTLGIENYQAKENLNKTKQMIEDTVRNYKLENN